ncbi:MAG: DUF4139 domain-containing protein [Spirochaetota bacterium]
MLKLWLLIISIWAVSPTWANSQTVVGSIQKVILYRNQALVTRQLEVDLPTGSHEIKVPNLPAGILSNSIFAEAMDLEVRSVRLLTRELSQDPEEKIRKLDADIEMINDEIHRVKKHRSLNKQKLSYLRKQESFVVATAKLELSKGVLKPNTMKELTQFHFAQREELVKEELSLSKELNGYYKQKSLLYRQRKKLTKTNLKKRDVLVYIEKKKAGKETISLNYLVGNSGWSPSYNFHAMQASKKVSVEFNARIHQLSGEDWKNVEMVLSNASPALSAVGPGISPFRIKLSASGPRLSSGDIERKSKNINRKIKQAYEKQSGSKSWDESQEYNWVMNSAANEYQGLELVAQDDELDTLKKNTLLNSSAPSVSYSLEGRVSVDSKKQDQLIRVRKVDLPSELYRVATPILTTYVFREAEIENNAIEVLLSGPVNAYLDNRFVGKGEIPNIARGQSFVMGFGIDTRIRTKRELVEKKEKILGGNKELSFLFRIQLENFHKEASKLRVMDRIPVKDEKENVRITLDLQGNELSKDKVYELNEKPKGILRWDITVPASANAAKTQTFEYNYKLEFDKNLKIQLPGSGGRREKQKLKDEFKEIQKMRYKY